MGGVIVANVTNFLSVTYQTKGLEIEGYALARCMNQEIWCRFELWVMCGFLSDFYLFFSGLCISYCSVFSKDNIHIVWMLMNQLLVLAPVNWKQRSRKINVIKCGYHLPIWHSVNNQFIRWFHEFSIIANLRIFPETEFVHLVIRMHC